MEKTNACVDSLLSYNAGKFGDLIAVFDDEEKLSYFDLDQITLNVAGWVSAQSLSGQPVVLHAKRSPKLVAVVLGLLRGGAICVPLDADNTSTRLTSVLARLGSRTTIIMDPATWGNHALRLAQGHSCVELAAVLRHKRAAHTPFEESKAFIFFTSGSTGVPKGVVLGYEAVMSGQHWLQKTFGGAPGDCFLFRSPIAVTNIVREIFWPLLCGGRSYVLGSDLHRDPQAHLKAIVDHSVVNLVATPALLEAVVNAGGFGGATSLMNVFATSDVCPQSLVKSFVASGNPARLFNLYGLTEALYATYHEIAVSSCGDAIPIGVPAELNACLVDDGGFEVPEGAVGELLLVGAGIADGYYNDDARTLARFGNYPGGMRSFRTGDLGIRDSSGCIRLVGRKDLQLKVRGHRIETEEVEAAMASHPAISAVGAVQIPIEGYQRLVLFYESRKPLQVAELRRLAVDTLPAYGVPSLFVHSASLSRTASGKVDRVALKETRLDLDDLMDGHGAPPENEHESVLMDLWRRHLKVSDIGIDSDFFELGGDSILAMLIAARAKGAGLSISVADFFARRTIRSLCARQVEDDAPKESVPEVGDDFQEELLKLVATTYAAVEVERTFNASPMEVGMLYHTILEPDSGVYYEQLTHDLTGRIELTLLQQAWNHVFQRSSQLRSGFIWNHGGPPNHVVVKDALPSWETLDYSGKTKAQAAQDFAKLLGRYRKESFDLRHPPLVRLLLVKKPDGSHWFTVNYHHILLDAWSFYLIVKSVFTAYQALAAGQPLNEVGFSDDFDGYVAALGKHDTAAGVRFWTEYLEDYSNPFHIASHYPGVRGHGDHTLHIGADLIESVRREARKIGVSANTIFIGAWLTLIWALSARREVCAGMIVTHRPPVVPDIEKLVGVCVNTIPVRSEIDDDEPIDEFLQRIFSEQLDLRRYEYLPVSDIHACSNLPSGMPLFDSLLIFENFQVDSDLAIATQSLSLECIQYDGWTNYPLSLTVNNVNDMSGLIDQNLVSDSASKRDGVTVRFKNDRRYFSDADSCELSKAFELCLRHILPSSDSLSSVRDILLGSCDYRPAAGNFSPEPSDQLGAGEQVSEETLNAVCREVERLLGRPVLVDDDFFDAGGTSFKALRLVGRMEALMGVQVPLDEFFDNPSALGLSRLLTGKQLALAP